MEVPGSLSELLAAAGARTPAAEIAFPAERAGFAELDARAWRLAAALHGAGVRAGEHVGILLGPGLDIVATIFAVARCGATSVPISDRFKAAELRYVVEHADLTTMITATGGFADFPARLRDALPGLGDATDPTFIELPAFPKLRRVLAFGEGTGPESLPIAQSLAAAGDGDDEAVRASAEAVGPESIAFLMYTSGTSAAPKGCMLSHRAFCTQGVSAGERWQLRQGDSFWCPLPLFHNGGISALLASLVHGASFCHPGRFDADTALAQLEGERATHALPAFEALWVPVLEHPRLAEADLSNLRLVEHSGVPELLRQFQARLPTATLVAQYGLTEAAGHLCITDPGDSLAVRTETSGMPLPGMEVRVVDEDNRPLDAGERGEIVFRGPMRGTAYYRDDEATARAIDAEGWFHSGDLGEIGADGRLRFHGRLKDVLKVGGENASAGEIEAYLLTHEAIRSVQVVPAPDARYGEVPAAFVELVAGAEASERELIDYCLGQIATFKVPRYVRFVDEWPMSGTKVKKFVLAERIAGELDAAGISEAPRPGRPTASSTSDGKDQG